MTAERDNEPDGLEAFFAAARVDPEPGDDLVARVLADAARVQGERQPVPVEPRRGFWDAIGGWVTVSGLAAACAAGVVVGVVLPNMFLPGFDGTFSTLLQGQEAIGFAGFDAVMFGLEAGAVE